jgi:hypothetical protein
MIIFLGILAVFCLLGMYGGMNPRDRGHFTVGFIMCIAAMIIIIIR